MQMVQNPENSKVHQQLGQTDGASVKKKKKKTPICQCKRHRDASSVPGWVRSPGGGQAAHSRILAWRIPWTGESGGPQSMGSQLSILSLKNNSQLRQKKSLHINTLYSNMALKIHENNNDQKKGSENKLQRNIPNY